MIVRLFFFYIFFIQYQIEQIHCETVNGCTINNNNRRSISSNKTSVTLSCENNGYILVRNLTFGVHKTLSSTCSYQSGDCTTHTTYIGMECNGLTKCNLDLNPQYLHICSQYSDYMVLDYSCLQGESLSICDNHLISTTSNDMNHRLFIRSLNYPNEYDNSLNCSCEIKTKKSIIKILDFSLEERDEMNICSRDYLQIGNQSYCDSSINNTSIILNSSIYLTFKTNDVITRKGFWLMIDSEQSIEVSCKNSFESPFPTTTPLIIVSSINLSTNSFNTIRNSTILQSTRHDILSLILKLTIIFVIALFLLNLILIILCWKRKRSKENIKSKLNNTHRPFSCSKRLSSSSSSSITYGETPVLTSLDTQKRQTTSTTTTATGTYEDPNEFLTLQHQQQKLEHSLYLQNQHETKTFCPIILPSCSTNTGYNQMIHCHFNTSSQTFYPHYPLDSQHIYETIQDGHCPYQRLAATLRRQQQQQQQRCTCSCTYNEQNLAIETNEHDKDLTIGKNPETLV
ncbi:unnamed protein product [Adineta steineri]|uniref:CUB domain-containing protein n=1 Tax=Adineta steineri TaxID=433720 RepID=A0A814HT74_9BILA|nr:unnamed protein product [Adineta steineri]CAF3736982.1 unnamed protein product [Adineta steineri]